MQIPEAFDNLGSRHCLFVKGYSLSHFVLLPQIPNISCVGDRLVEDTAPSSAQNFDMK
jgi:hypothetical protein